MPQFWRVDVFIKVLDSDVVEMCRRDALFLTSGGFLAIFSIPWLFTYNTAFPGFIVG